MAIQHGDGGFSLIELLLVIVILGMLATIVAFTVGGVSAESQGAGTDDDRRPLAHRDGATSPAAGTGTRAHDHDHDHDHSAERFLQSPSPMLDLDADGQLVGSTGSPRTT